MYGEIGVTGSVNEEPHSLDIQGDQKEVKCGFTQSIIHELHSWDIQ